MIGSTCQIQYGIPSLSSMPTEPVLEVLLERSLLRVERPLDRDG